MQAFADPVIGVVAGAVVAALGYVGKLVVQGWTAWRHGRAQRTASLLQLQALLEASRVAFLVQRKQANRLAKLLKTRYPDDTAHRPGLERLFSELHGHFNQEENDLHLVIRSYSQHALRPLNEAILAWLREDIHFRVASEKTGSAPQLAIMLNQLESHLLMWMAKYEGWIPNRPEHALVYLADEEEHGLAFPKGIEEILLSVLSRDRPHGGPAPRAARPNSLSTRDHSSIRSQS
jgi:hypothetical protein